jgi:peptidyl-prolyl cis-trans isomerase B (cyclophilin B)
MSGVPARRRGSVGTSWIVPVAVLVAASLLTGCWGKSEGRVIPPPPDPRPKAVIKTKFGEMEMRFYPELAPNHVENFIKLAKSGFYNGTIFHRVIPGFMIQGGDPNTKYSLRKETFGQGGPKDEKGNPILLKGEFSDTPHKRGIVSMARANEPDTAGSQFFIVVEDSFFLDRKYTVFGGQDRQPAAERPRPAERPNRNDGDNCGMKRAAMSRLLDRIEIFLEFRPFRRQEENKT